MEGVIIIMDGYTLKPGNYIICDPAYIINKQQPGRLFYQKMIDAFYKDMNAFHYLTIDHISFYMFRSLGGDGIFDGVATDSGTFIIIDVAQLKNDNRFKQDYSIGKIKRFQTKKSIIAKVENFDLTMSNGIFIHTE